MHITRDHAWNLKHVTLIRLANMDSDILYKIEHTSGENGFPLQEGEELVLPSGERFVILRRELRYHCTSAGAGTFKTTAYLEVHVATA